MDTHVRTPMDVFHLPQHLVIPLFQRPYVWSQDEQWLPLWQDVRRLAEVRLKDPYSQATHFLGAVVLQAHDGITGLLPARNVIDGQQRLTTLQLLMDATVAVLEELGLDGPASQLDVLTHNMEQFTAADSTRLKVRHTNRDRAAFDEVMSAEPPVAHDSLTHAGSLIARAHRFFVTSVSDWLRETTDTPQNTPAGSDAAGVTHPEDRPAMTARATTLVHVLTRGLQLVVIDLLPQENSQEIFETLNARGTPLTAADLVKNFVFQRLEAEGVNTRRAYAEDWPFEAKFWETEVSVGRYAMSRSSLFLNQWLVSRVGEEISPKSTFSRFKHYVDHECGQKMSELLVELKEQADRYQAWTTAAADPDRALSTTEMAVYRMDATGIELLKPILLWLHDPERQIATADREAVVRATESWVLRRLMLRLTLSGLGRVVADLIRAHRAVPGDQLPARVTAYLTRLSVATTYWPGDQEIRTALAADNAYRRFPRGRLRMFLEAVEDQLRAQYKQPPVSRRGYPIEHVLPQKWETNWPVKGLEAEIARGEHVHRLGNLTLLTSSLNASVSNGPWGTKRDKLARHDVFLLNRGFREPETETWDEAGIDARTDRMLDALLSTWPVPAGHTGEIADRPAPEQAWVEVKHLVAAGLLPVGSVLTPRQGAWMPHEALVQADGRLLVDGKMFDSSSAAGKYVKGAVTNGWWFWHLPDGRRLMDLRAEYRGDKPTTSTPPFDWTTLHNILEALPEGVWTTYGDLADAVGTAPQPLGTHVAACGQCANAHRILTAQGRVSSGFTWNDPDYTLDPKEMLAAEGVRFEGDRADAGKRLDGDALGALIDDGDTSVS